MTSKHGNSAHVSARISICIYDWPCTCICYQHHHHHHHRSMRRPKRTGTAAICSILIALPPHRTNGHGCFLFLLLLLLLHMFATACAGVTRTQSATEREKGAAAGRSGGLHETRTTCPARIRNCFLFARARAAIYALVRQYAAPLRAPACLTMGRCEEYLSVPAGPALATA